MKSLNISTGGHPRKYYNDDLTHLNEALTETCAALGAFLGQNYYLSDVNIGPSGGNTTCAAGWLVYKGEPCQFGVQNIPELPGPYVLAWVPDVSYRSLDPISYADLSSQSPHKIKKVKLQYVDPGSLPADYVYESSFLTRAKAVLTQAGDLTSWTTMNPLLNGATIPSGFDALQYRLNAAAGWVELRGSVETGSSGIVFQLPVALRPAKIRYISVVAFGGGNAHALLTVNTDGTLNLDNDALFIQYSLEGVRYYL